MNELKSSWTTSPRTTRPIYARFVPGDITRTEFIDEGQAVLGGFASLDREGDKLHEGVQNLLAKTRLRTREPKSTAALAVEWVPFKLMMSPNTPELTWEAVQEKRRELEKEIAE